MAYLVYFDEVNDRHARQRVLLGDNARWIIDLNDDNPKFKEYPREEEYAACSKELNDICNNLRNELFACWQSKHDLQKERDELEDELRGLRRWWRTCHGK